MNDIVNCMSGLYEGGIDNANRFDGYGSMWYNNGGFYYG
jgi:hypothetical protein